tara:strand:- start:3035 stop:3472 length:438 start_codon:yes stop_codon:yes gene_type:complete
MDYCLECKKQIKYVIMEDGSKESINLDVEKKLVVNSSLTKGAVRFIATMHSETCDGGLLIKSNSLKKGTNSRMANEPKRIGCQKSFIISLFKERKLSGVWTSELASIARKYSARISELRGDGHDIVLVERKEGGNNRYVLINYDC